MNTLMKKIYNVIRDDEEHSGIGKAFDAVLIVLILLTLAFIILDSFDMPTWFRTMSLYFEYISVAVFSVEYILRVWTAPCIYPSLSKSKARIKYISSFMAIVDLVSIIPFYLPFVISIDLRPLRVVRLLRLFRIFKFSRYTYAISTIFLVFKRRASQLISSFFIIALLMLVCSILLYSVEREVQPDGFKNALSGISWIAMTVTGGWFSTLLPITLAGKIIGGIMAMISVCVVAVPTGIIGAEFVEIFKREKRSWATDSSVPYDDIAISVERTNEQYKKEKIDKRHFDKQMQDILDNWLHTYSKVEDFD